MNKKKRYFLSALQLCSVNNAQMRTQLINNLKMHSQFVINAHIRLRFKNIALLQSPFVINTPTHRDVELHLFSVLKSVQNPIIYERRAKHPLCSSVSRSFLLFAGKSSLGNIHHRTILSVELGPGLLRRISPPYGLIVICQLHPRTGQS